MDGRTDGRRACRRPLPPLSLSPLSLLSACGQQKREKMTPRAGQSAHRVCVCLCVLSLSFSLLSQANHACQRSWSLGSRYHSDSACHDREGQQLSFLLCPPSLNGRETRSVVIFTLFAHMFALSPLVWSPIIKRGCTTTILPVPSLCSSSHDSLFSFISKGADAHTHEPRPFQVATLSYFHPTDP